ncbi:GIY-YIG nuclease family protein [Chryseobacterium caseinilyticum]|uniref:GIY-YIG nuclease family protein n=1 Tax=Chryseobacterium caseinilyticum TaxID=2771428 RepID=A0ABR8ZD28_9FLAO|nr:GIY-YIG nuclease family protein [Chryseobacterium caseinilyticum]MBD8083210.1 GIY-YIG nuclease family protein [Chryseobacterium caseinilyticum]
MIAVFFMYYIYILHSESADKYYIGYTEHPAERLLKHNQQENFNTFTRKFRPWKMIALFEVSTEKSAALKIEKFIKKQKSRKFLQMLCDTESQLAGELAQLVRVPILRD